MPRGPRGEKRPADAIGRAIKIAQIATGEEEDERDELSSAEAARNPAQATSAPSHVLWH